MRLRARPSDFSHTRPRHSLLVKVNQRSYSGLMLSDSIFFFSLEDLEFVFAAGLLQDLSAVVCKGRDKEETKSKRAAAVQEKKSSWTEEIS